MYSGSSRIIIFKAIPQIFLQRGVCPGDFPKQIKYDLLANKVRRIFQFDRAPNGLTQSGPSLAMKKCDAFNSP